MDSRWTDIIAAFLHALGVAAYLGGAITMEFVVGPAQKAIPPAQQAVMGEKTANRFLVIAWSALGLIFVSGILRLYSTDKDQFLTSERLWDTMYGRTLLAMLILWAVLVVNGAIITFVLRPKLQGRMGAGVAAAQAQARQQQMMGAATWIERLTRVDLGIAVLVAFLGSSLAFGGVLG